MSANWVNTHPFPFPYHLPMLNVMSRVPIPATSRPRREMAFVNAVWFGNWRLDDGKSPATCFRPDIISHIFYSHASVDSNGNVSLSNGYLDTQIPVDGTNGGLSACTALRRVNPAIKVILSVGGRNVQKSVFKSIAANPQARENFAKSARHLVDRYDLDGINIDWAGPESPKEPSNYLELLRKARDHLPAPRYSLTASLPPDDAQLQLINVVAASRHVDLFNVATYDFSGPGFHIVGHHAQLYTSDLPLSAVSAVSVFSIVTFLRKAGVPARKIVIGIPAYGRSFLGATHIGDLYNGFGGINGIFEYNQLPREDAFEGFDGSAGAAYCVGADCGFVSFDNPTSVSMKAEFVRSNNLAGLYYWEATGDTNDDRSLVLNGYHSLHPLL